MVSDCRDELIRHFSTSDLDAVAEYLIDIASDAFLDKCLEKRLLTIEAKPLINALARAERLGYEQSDIIDMKDQHEQVIPHQGYQYPGIPQLNPAPFATVPSSFQSGATQQPQPLYHPSSNSSSSNNNNNSILCRCHSLRLMRRTARVGS